MLALKSKPQPKQKTFPSQKIMPVKASTTSTPATTSPSFGSFNIQSKLKIGVPNDKYEQEADHLADEIMRMPNPVSTSAVAVNSYTSNSESESPSIQRTCANCSMEEDKTLIQAKTTKGATPEGTPVINTNIQSLQGGGRPLSRSERSFFEPRFGADFSGVRVHNDARAASLAHSVSARAFTLGNNVVFGSGEYSSDSFAGRKLFAHELTHVIQQSMVENIIQQKPKKSKKISQIKRVKLSFYQDSSEARNFFKLLADKKARDIRSVYLDRSTNCPNRASFGSIPYKTGFDIIEAITKAYWCTGHQVKEVHIFSHAGSGGVYGSGWFSDKRGLYAEDDKYSSIERDEGGRAVSDIPLEALANNIIFVLHGCSAASGDNSFAEKLLKTIVGTSSKARVFGHFLSGTCGRNKDWRVFSNRYKEGKKHGSIP